MVGPGNQSQSSGIIFTNPALKTAENVSDTRDEAIARERSLKQPAPTNGTAQEPPTQRQQGPAMDHAALMRRLKHHALIATAVDVYPAMATTVRLFVRWLGAQLLSNHVCDEAAELIVAAAFAGPSPLPVPGMHMQAAASDFHTQTSPETPDRSHNPGIIGYISCSQ